MSERLLLGSGSAYVEQHHKARYEWALRQLKGLEGVILDIACGTGYGSRMLADGTTCLVTGLDASADAIAYAASQYSGPNLSFQVGDAEHLAGIDTDSVSALVSFETIEHLSHPRLFLSEAARVLKDAGVLLISTPDRRLASTLYPIRRRPNNPYHLFEYTLPEFCADLERLFHVRSMWGQCFVPRWLTLWPVQVGAKAICYALRRYGAYEIIDRYYHDANGVEVTPACMSPRSVANFWVAICSPR